MKKKTRNTILAGVVTLAVIILGAVAWLWPMALSGSPSDGTVLVPRGATVHQVVDSIAANVDGNFAVRVHRVLDLLDSDLSRREGAYVVKKGDTPLEVARRIRNHVQSPVRFTFNNVRTAEQFADRFAARFMAGRDAMLATLRDSVLLDSLGCNKDDVMCLLLPDTYEFFWTVEPRALLVRMAQYHDRFWTAERRAKADALGLTPKQVQIIASIVEEETAKADEKPVVGRLYVNRVRCGMPLQADPTVKFALGDFTIRRLTLAMTRVASPYNTYYVTGLPPGPIRLAEKSTIDAVLNAPEHDYLYMCAKEDFSGYHNFAHDLATHNANARRYQAALNARGIH